MLVENSDIRLPGLFACMWGACKFCMCVQERVAVLMLSS